MNPVVSIILPMKNASEWVAETIESVQKQTLEEWELVIVDDHSEDDSHSLVAHIALSDARIRLFRNHGQGIIPALQLAFSEVRGMYLTRMDADDIMPEYRLQRMVAALDLLPEKAIVTGKVRYFSAEFVSEGYQKYENWLNERVVRSDFYDHIYRECIVASPNWMGRTKEFREYGLLENLSYPEDYDLCFKWMQHGFQISGLDEVTLLWREHPLRTSRNSENYQQRAFFHLKIHWLIRTYPDVSSIGIVGMGIKGKLCAELLMDTGRPFNLYDLHFEKYTTPLFGQTVLSPDTINDSIVLIARYPEKLDEIRTFIELKGYQIGKDAFWV